MSLIGSRRLYDNFLQKWPVSKMQNISLNEYTNLNKTSFTYDIEHEMEPLGSIRGAGVGSFLFGIYEREQKDNKQSTERYIYTFDYAWQKKLGTTKEKAFEDVREKVNEVIKCAQNSNLKGIEQIDLAESYKWKIAFHYQDLKNITITPVFTRKALELYVKKLGENPNQMSIADIHQTIKNHEKYKDLDEVLNIAKIIWSEYQNLENFDATEEKQQLKNNPNLTQSQKTNATSDIDYLEYEIKSYKVMRRNPHNHLEKSFNDFK